MNATKLLAVGVMLGWLGASAIAQDKPVEKTFSLHSYGDKGQVALESFAAALGYPLRLPSEGDDVGGSVEDPCWFAFKDKSAEQAAAILGCAMGVQVTVNHERKWVSAGSVRGSGGRSIKGYDVSALASRYVEYVNRYGASKKAEEGRPVEEQTASEHLLDVLEDVLVEFSWGDVGATCVGQRILLNLAPDQHEKVREFLALLFAEKGGSSKGLAQDTAARVELAKMAHKDEYNERPLGSVLASIFGKSVGFVVEHSLAQTFSSEHVTRPVVGKETVVDVLNELALQQRFSWATLEGVVFAHSSDTGVSTGYRVFEMAPLLERLAVAYTRQQTQPNKQGGFSGDIRSRGGIRVITDALNRSGKSAQAGFNITTFGSRLIIKGTATDIEGALAILKEIGFEEPKDD